MCQDDEITQDFPSLPFICLPWTDRLPCCLGGEAMDLCDRASCQICASSDHLAAPSPRETGADTDSRHHRAPLSGHKCSHEVARLLHMILLTLSLIQSHKSRLNNLVVTLMKLRGSHTSHSTEHYTVGNWGGLKYIYLLISRSQEGE